jgi:hypothetical protein
MAVNLAFLHQSCYFSVKCHLSYPPEAGWAPFETHYLPENMVAPAIEPRHTVLNSVELYISSVWNYTIPANKWTPQGVCDTSAQPLLLPVSNEYVFGITESALYWHFTGCTTWSYTSSYVHYTYFCFGHFKLIHRAGWCAVAMYTVHTVRLL